MKLGLAGSVSVLERGGVVVGRGCYGSSLDQCTRDELEVLLVLVVRITHLHMFLLLLLLLLLLWVMFEV